MVVVRLGSGPVEFGHGVAGTARDVRNEIACPAPPRRRSPRFAEMPAQSQYESIVESQFRYQYDSAVAHVVAELKTILNN